MIISIIHSSDIFASVSKDSEEFGELLPALEHVWVVFEFFTESVSLLIFEFLDKRAEGFLSFDSFVSVVDLFVKFVHISDNGLEVFHLVKLIGILQNVVQVWILFLDYRFVFDNYLMMPYLLIRQLENSIVIVLLLVDFILC